MAPMRGNRPSSPVDCPVFVSPHGLIKTGAPYMRFVSPLAAGVAMSGGSGIVRTGAAARCGRRRRDCAGAGWHPLARRPRRRTSVAVAAATAHRVVLDESLPSVMGSIGLHVTGGQRGDTCRPRARMERPFPCTVVCRFDAPAEGRAAAGRFDVEDLLRPCWWAAPGRTRGRETLPGPGAGGWTRCRARPRGRGLRQGPRARGHPDRGSRSHDRVGCSLL